MKSHEGTLPEITERTPRIISEEIPEGTLRIQMESLEGSVETGTVHDRILEEIRRGIPEGTLPKQQIWLQKSHGGVCKGCTKVTVTYCATLTYTAVTVLVPCVLLGLIAILERSLNELLERFRKKRHDP